MALQADLRAVPASGVTWPSETGAFDALFATDLSTRQATGPGGELPDAVDFHGATPDAAIAVAGVPTPIGHTSAYTFAAWVQADSYGSEQMFIDNRDGYAQGVRIQIWGSASSWRVEHGTTPTTVTGVLPPVGDWFHFAVVFGSGSIRVFVNGVQSGPPVAATDISVSNPARLGGNAFNLGNQLLQGRMAGVYLLNHADDTLPASGYDEARPTATVTVDGTTQVGQVLTATPTTNDGTATLQLEWLRADDQFGGGAVVIPGATARTYTLQIDDLNKWVACRATYTNTGGAGLVGTATSSYRMQVTSGASLTVVPNTLSINADVIGPAALVGLKVTPNTLPVGSVALAPSVDTGEVTPVSVTPNTLPVDSVVLTPSVGFGATVLSPDAPAVAVAASPPTLGLGGIVVVPDVSAVDVRVDTLAVFDQNDVIYLDQSAGGGTGAYGFDGEAYAVNDLPSTPGEDTFVFIGESVGYEGGAYGFAGAAYAVDVPVLQTITVVAGSTEVVSSAVVPMLPFSNFEFKPAPNRYFVVKHIPVGFEVRDAPPVFIA